MPAEITINPETLLLDGLEDRPLTADEFAQIRPPACPVCGTTVTIDRIDITLNAEELARQGRTYIAGRWECPRGCNPRTGQRMHYSQSASRSMGAPGVTLTCSCGDETVALDQAEMDAWRAEHRAPD